MLGSLLRQARRARGWSLADAVAVSDGTFKASTLAAYERGERRVPAHRLYELARLYGTPVSALYPPTGDLADQADLVEQISHLPEPHRALLTALVERMLTDTRPASPGRAAAIPEAAAET